MPLQPNLFERLLIKWGLIPGPLLDLGLSNFMSTALIGAGEIDLFRKLDEGPTTLDQLAQQTNTNRRALKNLIQVLQPLGYLEMRDGKYALTKYTRKTVPIEIFHQMIPFFKKQMLRNTKYAGKALKEAPEDGIYGWDNVKSGEEARSYQVSMRWLASSTVDEVTKKINLPRSSKRMLDIGGSHGLYSVEMCRKYSGLRATVMDWPVGIENAEKTLRQESEVANRIDTLEADFFKDEFPDGYDYAFFGNIIHGNSPEQNQKLFNRLGKKLTDKGTIGILDQFDNISGSRFNQSVAALIGWNLFLFANGRAYEVDDVKSWLKDAGFPHTTVTSLKKSPGFTLLIATK